MTLSLLLAVLPCKQDLRSLSDQLLHQMLCTSCAKIQAGIKILGMCSAKSVGTLSAKLPAE